MPLTNTASAIEDVDVVCNSMSGWKASGNDLAQAIYTEPNEAYTLTVVTKAGNEDSDQAKLIQEAFTCDKVKEFLDTERKALVAPAF